MWQNSGKLLLLDKLLTKLKRDGHRVLVFTQMTKMLDILEDYARVRRHDYCRIDGQTPQNERDDAMDVFNAAGSRKFLFLLSTRAGGLGINLQTADTVVLYDSDWNPQMDLQAMDRAHRIGQKSQVRVFRLVCEDTVEQLMVERATKKLFLDALVMKQGKLSNSDNGVSTSELNQMVKFGAQRIFSSSESTITDDDIDLILAQGQARTEAEAAKLKAAGQHDLLNFSLASTETNFQVFAGKDYSGFKAAPAELTFVQLPERAKKSNYSESAYFLSRIIRRRSTFKRQGSARVPSDSAIRLSVL